MKKPRSTEEDRETEAFLREHPVPTARDVLRWRRRDRGPEDAAGRKNARASVAAIEAESRFLSAGWQGRSARRGHPAGGSTDDAEEGLFPDPDGIRDGILAALIDECPVPTLADVRRWRSRHPRYGREIALFAFDVMSTAIEGGSPAAPCAEDLLGVLGLALRSLEKARSGPTMTRDR